MSIKTARIIAAALLAGLASSAGASLIYNNGLPNQSGGSEMNEFLEADNFSLGASTLLNTVRFWSLQTVAADYSGTIDWSIRQNTAGIIGSVLASGLAAPAGVSTGATTLGLNEFRYEFGISELLAAGDYFLVLHNGANGTTPAGDFYWAWASDTGDSMNFDQPSSGPWTSNLAELAFQLEGTAASMTVPEPSTFFLVAASGLAAAARRRRIPAA